MDIKRKVQLSAAVVIANGLMALSATTPRLALADSCPGVVYTCHACYTVAQCQAQLPSGCTTATSAQCFDGTAFGCPDLATFCYYQ